MRHTELSREELLRACAQSGDAEAWEEFVRRFQRLIATVAMRTARRWGETSSQVFDDLIQETYLKLCADRCRLLREFKPQHPDAILGYLKVLTANVVHDHFKRLHTAKRHDELVAQGTERVETVAEEEHAGSPRAIEREILLKEIDACLCLCSSGVTHERDRRIFWLYYRLGLSARAIASLPSVGLSVKGVESTILRLTRLLRRELGERRARESSKKEPFAEKGIQSSESF